MEALGVCDADGSSRAVVRVRTPKGGTLEFCLHHWQQQELTLVPAGYEVINDERESLYIKT